MCALIRFTGRMCNVQRNCHLIGSYMRVLFLPNIKVRLYIVAPLSDRGWFQQIPVTYRVSPLRGF
jgi:hypothetical protein